MSRTGRLSRFPWSKYFATIPLAILAIIIGIGGLVLTIIGLFSFGYLIKKTFELKKVARERMQAALVLIFFQMLFFAFFEQAGSSTNNFTDRNIDRVGEEQVVTKDMVGQTIESSGLQGRGGAGSHSAGLRS